MKKVKNVFSWFVFSIVFFITLVIITCISAILINKLLSCPSRYYNLLTKSYECGMNDGVLFTMAIFDFIILLFIVLKTKVYGIFKL